jgi:hypothetical protein
MITRRLFAATVLGAFALLFIVPTGAGVVDKKPTYRLVASISGVPGRITPRHRYTYTITIRNTGVRMLRKVVIEYSNGGRIRSSTRQFRRLRGRSGPKTVWKVARVRPGATRRIEIGVVYRAGRRGRVKQNAIIARVPGTSVRVKIRKPARY